MHLHGKEKEHMFRIQLSNYFGKGVKIYFGRRLDNAGVDHLIRFKDNLYYPLQQKSFVFNEAATGGGTSAEHHMIEGGKRTVIVPCAVVADEDMFPVAIPEMTKDLGVSGLWISPTLAKLDAEKNKRFIARYKANFAEFGCRNFVGKFDIKLTSTWSYVENGIEHILDEDDLW